MKIDEDANSRLRSYTVTNFVPFCCLRFFSLA